MRSARSIKNPSILDLPTNKKRTGMRYLGIPACYQLRIQTRLS